MATGQCQGRDIPDHVPPLWDELCQSLVKLGEFLAGSSPMALLHEASFQAHLYSGLLACWSEDAQVYPISLLPHGSHKSHIHRIQCQGSHRDFGKESRKLGVPDIVLLPSVPTIPVKLEEGGSFPIDEELDAAIEIKPYHMASNLKGPADYLIDDCAKLLRARSWFKAGYLVSIVVNHWLEQVDLEAMGKRIVDGAMKKSDDHRTPKGTDTTAGASQGDIYLAGLFVPAPDHDSASDEPFLVPEFVKLTE